MTGPCSGCGKPAEGELIVGNLYTFMCDACDAEAEADWQAVVGIMAEKIERGDFDVRTRCACPCGTTWIGPEVCPECGNRLGLEIETLPGPDADAAP